MTTSSGCGAVIMTAIENTFPLVDFAKTVFVMSARQVTVHWGNGAWVMFRADGSKAFNAMGPPLKS